MSMEKKTISAIILAGGYSARMGRNKAALDFHGVTFLQHQVYKLCSLGINDIVVSGYENTPEGCRFVPDVYPHRGPLSGIHAGLLAVKENHALVLAVDTPLVPQTLLQELIEMHKAGITIASCKGELEPLIGVYDKSLAPLCGEILQGERSSVRRLLDQAGHQSLAYTLDPRLLAGSNTPEEYAEVLKYSYYPQRLQR